MNGFSTGDGFVEIAECLAEMIKYVANEPSVGLFYIQQHTQNAVPNLVSLKNIVVGKSREAALHAEDSEDSITMVRLMKECGIPIADEMVKDIKKSLALVSSKQPKRGLVQNPVSGFQMGRTSSWGPASWVLNSVSAHDDDDDDGDGKNGWYLSTVIKSAKEQASSLKWPQLVSIETKGEKLLSYAYPNPPLSIEAASTSSTCADMEADEAELPLSVQAADEHLEEEVEGSPSHSLLKVVENFDEFKADKEAKLEEWLEG